MYRFLGAGLVVRSLGRQRRVCVRVLAQRVRSHEPVGLAGRQAAEVSDGHGHLGAGDVVGAAVEARPQGAHRNVGGEGLRQAHL